MPQVTKTNSNQNGLFKMDKSTHAKVLEYLDEEKVVCTCHRTRYCPSFILLKIWRWGEGGREKGGGIVHSSMLVLPPTPLNPSLPLSFSFPFPSSRNRMHSGTSQYYAFLELEKNRRYPNPLTDYCSYRNFMSSANMSEVCIYLFVTSLWFLLTNRVRCTQGQCHLK